MEIEMGGVTEHDGLVYDFCALASSIEGLEETTAKLKTIITNITATDDTMKYGVAGDITTTLVKAVNAIEDDINDTIVVMEVDVGILSQMFMDYKKYEEVLVANFGK